MSTNENDVVDIMVYTNTHTDLLFFTDKGKVYRKRGHNVPEFGRTSKGLPVVNLLNIEPDEKVKAILEASDYSEDKYFFFVTQNGIVKRTLASEFASIRQNGKIAIDLREGDQLLSVKVTNGDTYVGIAANNGKMVKFHENDVRPMGRTASGVKGINLEGGYKAIGVVTSLEGKYVLAITDRGFGKMSLFDDYRLTTRGAKGVITIKSAPKVGVVNSVSAVEGNDDEDLMVITVDGIVIRTPINQIKIAGRNTQGVRIIRIEDKQRVSSIAIVAHEEEANEQPVEANVQETTSTNEVENKTA